MDTAATKTGLLSKIKTFDTLRNYRNFRLLWLNNLTYQIGMWMQTLVMGWLAYELTKSVFLAALFAAARLSPQLLGPFTGTIADRVDRIKLLIAAQVIQLILAATLALLFAAGVLNYPLLALFGFVGGIVWSFAYTTGNTVAMDIVGQKDITNAIALNVVAMDLTRIIGPALGGILISVLGPATCFWIVSALSIPTLIALSMIRMETKKAPSNRPSVMQTFLEGFRYVTHNRDLLSVYSISFLANIFVWPAYQSFMPVFAKDNLGLGPDGLGFLQMSCGIGALVGAVVIASLGNFTWKGSMFLWGTLLYGAFFGLFAISGNYPVALVLIALAGMFSSAFGAMQSTMTLILAPPEMRSRCMGFLAMAIGILPFGCIALGAIANVIGAGLTTGISCALLVVSLIAIAIWFPNIRRL